MKKSLSLLLALSLLFALSACDWFAKIEITDDDITTTAASTETTEPLSDTPAPLEPLQGGPMLYPFFGGEPYKTELSEDSGNEYPVYPIGLVSQNGKLASPAVYHKVEYIYDEAEQRVIGLAAVKDREFTVYELAGTSRVLPIEGFNLEVCPGGRYALVNAAEGDGLRYGGGSWTDPLKDGLYDLKNNRWAIEPKEGQLLNYKRGGLVLCYQYDTPDATGNETAQWAFKFTDESTLDLPLPLGRVQDYYPETGWFGAMWAEKRGNDWTTGAYEERVYDKDLQVIPALSGWSVDWEGFRGGERCMLYNNNAFPGVSTWVSREGKLSDQRFTGMLNIDLGGQCYRMEDSNGRVTLLDASLNEVLTTKAGEQLVALWAFGNSVRGDGYLLVDKAGDVKAAYGTDAAPLRLPAEFHCWYNDVTNGVYSPRAGQLCALDLTQFFPKPKADHRGGQPYAHAIAACEDFVVVQAGVHWYEGSPAVYDTFAVDWDGQPYDACPLAPFFDVLTYRNAGDQGPYYYWVELDGQRGYINTSGEWLFIDEG